MECTVYSCLWKIKVVWKACRCWVDQRQDQQGEKCLPKAHCCNHTFKRKRPGNRTGNNRSPKLWALTDFCWWWDGRGGFTTYMRVTWSLWALPAWVWVFLIFFFFFSSSFFQNESYASASSLEPVWLFKVLKRDLKYNYICVYVYELHRTYREGHSQGINRVMNLLPCNS